MGVLSALVGRFRSWFDADADDPEPRGPTAQEAVEGQLRSAENELKFAGGDVLKEAHRKFDYEPFGIGGQSEVPTGYNYYINARLRELKHELFHSDPWLAEAYRRRDHERAHEEQANAKLTTRSERTPRDQSVWLTDWYRRNPSKPSHHHIDLHGRRLARRSNDGRPLSSEQVLKVETGEIGQHGDHEESGGTTTQ